MSLCANLLAPEQVSHHTKYNIFYSSLSQVYTKIRERGMPSEITICGGQSREHGVYVSETNEIDITMLTSRDETNPIYFVLKYDGELWP